MSAHLPVGRLMEHEFTCPYCGEEISMVLDLSVRPVEGISRKFGPGADIEAPGCCGYQMSDAGRTPQLCVVAVPQSPAEKRDVQREQAMRSP